MHTGSNRTAGDRTAIAAERGPIWSDTGNWMRKAEQSRKTPAEMETARLAKALVPCPLERFATLVFPIVSLLSNQPTGRPHQA